MVGEQRRQLDEGIDVVLGGEADTLRPIGRRESRGCRARAAGRSPPATRSGGPPGLSPAPSCTGAPGRLRPSAPPPPRRDRGDPRRPRRHGRRARSTRVPPRSNSASALPADSRLLGRRAAPRPLRRLRRRAGLRPRLRPPTAPRTAVAAAARLLGARGGARRGALLRRQQNPRRRVGSGAGTHGDDSDPDR